jgi:hypothetical protein
LAIFPPPDRSNLPTRPVVLVSENIRNRGLIFYAPIDFGAYRGDGRGANFVPQSSKKGTTVDTIVGRIEEPGASEVWVEAVEDAARRQRGRKHARWCYAGFGLGVVVGFGIAAIWGAMNKFSFINMFEVLILNLIWWPAVGLLGGNALGRPRLAERRSWEGKRLHLRLGTLMAIIAYLAFLMSVGVTSRRWDHSARAAYLAFARSDGLVTIFREQGVKSAEVVAQKRATIEGLRSGKIPDGLQPIQREFLRGLDLDPKLTPVYRKERRDLIQAGEERIKAMMERNVVVYRELTAYHEQLAAKYDQARWHPWLPVEPDPPAPPTQ